MFTIFDKIIEYGIIFLIVFTPLAVGTVSPWAYTTMDVTVCILVIICIVKLIITNIKKDSTTTKVQFLSHNSQSSNSQTTFAINKFGLAKTPLNVLIILFVGLIIFQLIPLPPGFLKIVSPNTYDLYKTTLPDWPDKASLLVDQSPYNTEHSPFSVSETVNHQAEENRNKSSISGKPVLHSYWMPISICPHATKMELFSMLIFIGMFLIITNTPKIRINHIMFVIISLGFSISLLGIMQKLTGTTKVYWIIESYSEFPFGPYINRNHFAGYICMVIPLALGLLISRFKSFFSSRRRHSKVAEFQSHLFANFLLVFVITIMILALFFSLSRGGILAFLISIAAFFIIIIVNRLATNADKGRQTIAFVLAILFAFMFLIWFGHNTALEWLSDASSPTTTRIKLFQDTINISRDFPIFGTGLGTFQNIYRKYKTIDDQFFYEHAHNDYLEILSDLGLIGFLIVLVGIVLFIRKVMLRWKERRDPFAKGITLGGVCSVFAILSHSLVDFNLHVPANALFLSIVLGLTFNTVNLKRTGY